MKIEGIIDKGKIEEISGSSNILRVFPSDVNQIPELLRFCLEEKYLLIPEGFGTGMILGGMPGKDAVLCSLSEMDGDINILPDDLAVRVGAGIKLDVMRQAVEEAGFSFPVDPTSADHSTVGGCFASDSRGLSHFRAGSMKEYVTGMTFISSDGDILTSGGLTKKNVSGYDITRMFAGSQGIFGIIVECFLRLTPLPEARYTVTCTYKNICDISRFMEHLLNNSSSLDRCEVFGGCCPTLKGKDTVEALTHTLAVRASGLEGTVRKKSRDIQSMMAQCGGLKPAVLTGDEADKLWLERILISRWIGGMGCGTLLKTVICSPLHTGEIIEGVKKVFEDFLSDEEKSDKQCNVSFNAVFGHLMEGKIHFHFSGNLEEFSDLRRLSGKVDVFLTSKGTKKPWDCYANKVNNVNLGSERLCDRMDPGGYAQLLKLKEALDPYHVFRSV